MVPLTVKVFTVFASPSISISFARTPLAAKTDNVVSSSVEFVSAVTVGASFTGFIEIFKVLVSSAVKPVLSVTVYVISGTGPLKLATGIN